MIKFYVAENDDGEEIFVLSYKDLEIGKAHVLEGLQGKELWCITQLASLPDGPFSGKCPVCRKGDVLVSTGAIAYDVLHFGSDSMLGKDFAQANKQTHFSRCNACDTDIQKTNLPWQEIKRLKNQSKGSDIPEHERGLTPSQLKFRRMRAMTKQGKN